MLVLLHKYAFTTEVMRGRRPPIAPPSLPDCNTNTQCVIGPHKCTCQMTSKSVERTDDRQTILRRHLYVDAPFCGGPLAPTAHLDYSLIRSCRIVVDFQRRRSCRVGRYDADSSLCFAGSSAVLQPRWLRSISGGRHLRQRSLQSWRCWGACIDVINVGIKKCKKKT